ncbi:hypothetical protein EDB19DRAFT_1917758 [Suillus lakei]|nr:hypothetical protein EDB19DRAFT_1917758 [Suillus lakei]
MSLKPDRRNRSWANRLLAALFRLFMPEEAPPELLLLLFHSSLRPGGTTSMPVTDWYSWMVDDKPDNRYLMCLLSHIDYCKCTGGAEHEFLLLYFRHWISSAEAVVCVDRTVELANGSRQSSEIISPSPSLKDTAASDHALLLGSPDDAVRHLRSQYGHYKKLCMLTFSSPSAPSVLQVAAILCLVHQQATTCMGGNAIDHGARARYCGVTLGPSPATVEAVCAAFLPEWQKTIDKLAQIRQRREAEPAQSRQEGFAEAEQAADERDRRAQAEIEQLRARVAALEGKTTASAI